MLSDYYQVAAVLQAVEGIVWVDLDQDQLKNPGGHNPVETPGVLIGFGEIEWETYPDGSKLGDGNMTIKLVVQLTAETFAGDPFGSTSNLEHLALIEPIDDALLILEAIQVSPYTHTNSYNSPPFYVVEQTYPVRLCRPARNYETVTLAVPVQITPVIKKPKP